MPAAPKLGRKPTTGRGVARRVGVFLALSPDEAADLDRWRAQVGGDLSRQSYLCAYGLNPPPKSKRP